MNSQKQRKFQSMLELWEYLPQDEREMVDVLRQIITENLPKHFTERLAYNVPCFYGRKRVCIIWPASVKGGGISKGVLFGFAQGHRLADPDHYLTHGTNKRIFYRIFHSAEDIDERMVIKLLKEAVALDAGR